VTPGGRGMSKSGYTTVLVEGPITPNFFRHPRTSRIAGRFLLIPT